MASDWNFEKQTGPTNRRGNQARSFRIGKVPDGTPCCHATIACGVAHVVAGFAVWRGRVRMEVQIHMPADKKRQRFVWHL